MDDVKKDGAVPAAAKSIDPAALEMLAYADECGIETAFSRADTMKPCPIGETGACCRICSMGPCRLVGKNAEEKTGICGAVLLHVIHWSSPWAGAGARRAGARCVRRPSRSATVWVLTEGTGGSGCKVSELSTCGSLPTWPGRRRWWW